MKKTCTLLTLAAILSFSATAQIKKGAVLLGIDLGFNGSNFKQEFTGNEVKSSSTGFNVALLYGKAIKDNLFAGGSVSFSSSSLKQGNPEVTQTIKSYGASVWTRKYFPVYGPLYAFVNGSLYSTIGNNENPNNNPSKTNSFGLGLGVYPGVSIQLKQRFFLDASLDNLANIYYNRTSGETTNSGGNTVKQTSSSYGFSTSLGNNSNPLQLGIRWIIPGKG
jgi:Outer membrane protein beta-barrel domain